MCIQMMRSTHNPARHLVAQHFVLENGTLTTRVKEVEVKCNESCSFDLWSLPVLPLCQDLVVIVSALSLHVPLLLVHLIQAIPY